MGARTEGFREESARIARRCAIALVAANVAGALVVFVLGVYVIPAPDVADIGRLDLWNVVLLGLCLTVLFPIGGGLASRRYLCVSGGDFHPFSGAAARAGGLAPRAKYTSFFGKPSNVDSGRPKFLASSAFGVCPIQSVMLNVPNSEK